MNIWQSQKTRFLQNVIGGTPYGNMKYIVNELFFSLDVRGSL